MPSRFPSQQRCATPAGKRAFLAVEIKYTEAPGGVAYATSPRHDALSRAASVYADPDDPALRGGALQQLWRQQPLVAWCMDRPVGAEKLSGVGGRPSPDPWMPAVPFKLN